MNIFFLLLWTLSISYAKQQNQTDMFSFKCSFYTRDVVFVLDGSESISKTDFQLAQQFLTRMITFMKSSNNRNRIALVVFGNSADIVFNFSKYDSIDDMIKNLDSIKNQNGLTAIGKAFNLTWVELFPAMRTDAEKLVIFLTNNKYPAPYEYADKLKTAGVKILTIGIGSDINKKELDTLSTTGLLVLFDSFTDLLNGQQQVIKQMCLIKKTGLEVCKNPKLNLVILMPISFSLNDTTFEMEKSLVVKLLEKFNSVCPTGRIGIIFYANFKRSINRLHIDLDLQKLISRVKSFEREKEFINNFSNKISNIDYAIQIIHWEFKEELKDGVPYQILLISAGTNFISSESFKQTDDFKAEGDKIITVGIGSDNYSKEMKALSSNGKFLVGNTPKELEEISEIVYKMVTSDLQKKEA